MDHKILLGSINGKTKIQKHHQYLLYETYMVTGMSNLSSMYSKQLKDISDVTAKQMRKILAGRCTKLLDIFCPKTTYEATKLGFSGILCTHCKSLRTVFDRTNSGTRIHCYACRKHSRRPTTKMPNPNVIAGGYRD